MFKYLPSIDQIIKLAIAFTVVMAITDLVGGKDIILAPISWWKNRNAA